MRWRARATTGRTRERREPCKTPRATLTAASNRHFRRDHKDPFNLSLHLVALVYQVTMSFAWLYELDLLVNKHVLRTKVRSQRLSPSLPWGDTEADARVSPDPHTGQAAREHPCLHDLSDLG
jgi:hypothetical protein